MDESEQGKKLTAAIHEVAKRAREDFARVASVRFWPRRHPWIAVVVGLASGFVSGETFSAEISQPAARTREGGPGVRLSNWLSRLFHSLLALFAFGARAAILSTKREVLAIAKRRDNWFPPI